MYRIGGILKNMQIFMIFLFTRYFKLFYFSFSVDFDWLREIAPPSFKIKPMRRPDNNEVKKQNQVKKMDRLKDKMLKSMMRKEMKRMRK